ncbi:MAG TPA: FAD-dependent oxidoreductase, partial [Ilumatobacteraceae bacterium]
FLWGGDRFTEAATPRHVLVIGAGPAGLEAARVSAELGHRVMVVEATDEIGGQYRLAGLQPSRGQILDHIAWYGRELRRLGADVQLGVRLDASAVASFGADVVVVATGATPPRAGFQRALPMLDRIPGLEFGHDRVVAIHDVLDGSVVVDGRVLVLDDLGDWRGIGTAMFIQERRGSVTIATSAAVVGGGLFHSAADVPARQRFARAGGEMRPNTVVTRWDGGEASLCSTLTGAVSTESFDWLVLAETAAANRGLADALDVAGVAHHTIGDCVSPRRASLAIYEGRALALTL